MRYNDARGANIKLDMVQWLLDFRFVNQPIQITTLHSLKTNLWFAARGGQTDGPMDKERGK